MHIISPDYIRTHNLYICHVTVLMTKWLRRNSDTFEAFLLYNLLATSNEQKKISTASTLKDYIWDGVLPDDFEVRQGMIKWVLIKFIPDYWWPTLCKHYCWAELVLITFIWNLHIAIHHSMRTLFSNQFPINKQGLKLAVLQKGIKSLSDSLQLSLVILSLKINYTKAGSNSQALKITALQVGTLWKKTLNAGNYCRGTFGSEPYQTY